MTTLVDSRDVPVSTRNRDSLDRLEAASDLFHGYCGDPLALIDKALEEDPSFVMGHCMRAGLLISATDKSLEPMLNQSVTAAEALWVRANERERWHIAAARAWLDGEFEHAVRIYGDVLNEYPRDSLALQLAHLGDFFLGQSSMLRDRVARALPAWQDDLPGYGFVLGMYAFGLEETGYYHRAEEVGRRAVEFNAHDAWAIHAVAHVMEMQGRSADGIKWLNGRVRDWAPDNMLACHNWWHLALFHLEVQQTEHVLDIYDTCVRGAASEVVLDMIDASALLWRLSLRGISVSERWSELARAWAPKAEDAYYGFNDLHAMMAFMGAGEHELAQRLLNALTRRAVGAGTNAAMVRKVVLPLCRALYAFAHQDYATCTELILPVRAQARAMGGSNAQRDIVSLTLAEAALRAGNADLAAACAGERLQAKPESPFAWELRSRAKALNRRAGAFEAREASAGQSLYSGSARRRVAKLFNDIEVNYALLTGQIGR